MRKIEAYKCDHCKKFIREKKRLVRSHEKRCYHNPANEACITCIGLRMKTIDQGLIDVYDSDGCIETVKKEVDQQWCSVKDEYLYHLHVGCFWHKLKGSEVNNEM